MAPTGSPPIPYINTEDHTLLAKQVKLSPTLSPAALARAKGEATSSMELTVPEVDFTGLNYPAHSRNNDFMAQHLLVADPELTVVKDKQHFEHKGRQPFPQEMVQQMQAKFLLDSVEVRNGYLKYTKLVPKAAERGDINLQDLNITMRNVTNMPAHTSEQNPAVVQVSGSVMGKVSVHMEVYVPLLSENGYHRIKGEIASGNPEILNPMVVPTAFVRIESGYVSRGSFDVELTNDRATGTLHFIYRNFQISLLSKGTGGEQSLGKEVLSKLANWVAIKESNPDNKGEKPRVGKINVTRDPKKSVFSYWTDCLLDGVLSIAGLGVRAEKL